MRDTASLLARRLTAAGLTVAAAESLTGGRVAAALTRRPGSSAFFLGSVVAYANEVKIKLLDVPEAVLSEHGAVSEACARAMAQGVRRRLGARLAVAGEAGLWTAEHRFTGDRRAVTRAATMEALRFLARIVDITAPGT